MLERRVIPIDREAWMRFRTSVLDTFNSKGVKRHRHYHKWERLAQEGKTDKIPETDYVDFPRRIIFPRDYFEQISVA